jgi:hypothetical protein
MNVKLDGDGDLYKNIALVALEVQNDGWYIFFVLLDDVLIVSCYLL